MQMELVPHSSVGMLNYLPIIGQGSQLVAELLFSGFSDHFQARLPFLLLHSTINITSLIVLIIRPESQSAYMAGWYLNYLGAVSTMLLCAWASQHLQHEPEVRTVMFATGTVLSYINNAFIPLAAYPAREAPHWRIGAKVYLGFACLAASIFIGIWFGFRWEEKKKLKNQSRDEEGVQSTSSAEGSTSKAGGVVSQQAL